MAETIAQIRGIYPSCEFIDPDDEDISNGETVGYAQFHIVSKLTYELVTETQKNVTENLKQYGGWCESWGVWQE